MKTTGLLLVAILGVLALLEILNAFYDAFQRAETEDLADAQERGEDAVGGFFAPFLWFRLAIGGIGMVGREVSLWLHEIAHAVMQLVFLGQPRVVLCRNGGYAQSQPWFDSGPSHLLFRGGEIGGGGLMGLAPVLAMSAILYWVFVALTPLDARAILAEANQLATDASWASMWAVMKAHVVALGDARFWGVLGIFAAALLLAPAMTPSSTDYVKAAPHIPAYVAGTMVTVYLLGRAPKLAFIALVAAVFLWAAMTSVSFSKQHPVITAIGAFAASCALLLFAHRYGWLGKDSVRGIQRGLGVLLVALLLAASFYAAFIVFWFTSAALSLRWCTLGRMFKYLPEALYEVVTKFDTCTECNLHFRRKCDGCGRSAEEILAAEQAAYEEASTMTTDAITNLEALPAPPIDAPSSGFADTPPAPTESLLETGDIAAVTTSAVAQAIEDNASTTMEVGPLLVPAVPAAADHAATATEAASATTTETPPPTPDDDIDPLAGLKGGLA